MKKGIVLICLMLCCVFLGGCWNYQGLDTIDIVTGIAIDKNPETGMYLLTYEMVDTAVSGKDVPTEVKYVESQGPTLFGAIRNAKRKLINKLYGGNMQAIIISRQIAQEEGVLAILEMFLRDGEPRETLSVAISQEETAKSVLMTKGLDSKIISFEIHGVINEDNQTTSSTKNIALYQAYNAIKEAGDSLVLPILHLQQNNNDVTTESNGVALFRGDKLIGFLSPEQTLYYLFLVDEIKSAAVSLPYRSENSEISMEIKSNRSKTSVRYENGQLVVSVQIKTEMNLTELKGELDLSQEQERTWLEAHAAQFIEESTRAFFGSVQTEYKTDIFGLGRLLYGDHPDVWRQLEDSWDEIFSQAQFEVQVTVDIVNTGVLKNF
ncbi:Ger(x)C family spore germination protein [Desulforamulus aeronauticus]|uniref:Spore germination B3/ GerAC like, C-terminal n=1 Tax=Desulforamulus aeronauticus DSM 10349 TaxID=1121421 RepID=A0A1M6VSK1_9FIRM|nr:Ger(x)C family spore germination protein [Desulforamulus aeronauticus]SHK84492.1 Spore germination B3/ GerAC like, C-terminal [Desulforamulus aeronauticus DSM 10349]